MDSPIFVPIKPLLLLFLTGCSAVFGDSWWDGLKNMLGVIHHDDKITFPSGIFVGSKAMLAMGLLLAA